ncbi:hypothetical protein F4780DRAFT_779937 [Xylariomycetidae sp. FL0641]|nr:hypothetical protein F4780DRAFT_779937 [Xylariomycetidae sp. FL0641]
MQALPDEVFWVAARDYLGVSDIYSLALTSRRLWRVVRHELYAAEILSAQAAETIRDERDEDDFVASSLHHHHHHNHGAALVVPPPAAAAAAHPSSSPPSPSSSSSDDPYADAALPEPTSAAPRDPSTGGVDDNDDEETQRRARRSSWPAFLSRPRLTHSSALHWAAAAGSLPTATALVRAAARAWPPYVDAKTPAGHAALHLAAEAGHAAIVRLLLLEADAAAGAAPSGYYHYYYAPSPGRGVAAALAAVLNAAVPGILPLAGEPGVEDEDEEGVEEEDQPRWCGVDALGLAILNGHTAAAEALLLLPDRPAPGPQHQHRDRHCVPPQHLAALAGRRGGDGLLERVLRTGPSDAAHAPWRGLTPLHLAAAAAGVPSPTLPLLLGGASAAHLAAAAHWALACGRAATAAALYARYGAPLARNAAGEHPLAVAMREDGLWAATEALLGRLLQGGPDEAESAGDMSATTTKRKNAYVIREAVHSAVAAAGVGGGRNHGTLRRVIARGVGLGGLCGGGGGGSSSSGRRNGKAGKRGGGGRGGKGPETGVTALHVAAGTRGFPRELLELLLAREDVEVGARAGGLTALEWAVRRGAEAWKSLLLFRCWAEERERGKEREKEKEKGLRGGQRGGEKEKKGAKRGEGRK